MLKSVRLEWMLTLLLHFTAQFGRTHGVDVPSVIIIKVAFGWHISIYNVLWPDNPNDWDAAR